MTHICISKLTITGSDNGLLPGWHPAIIWTNAGILFIGLPGTNFNGILIEIHEFEFNKIHFKISSGKWRPFCLGLNVLTVEVRDFMRSCWAFWTTSSGHGDWKHDDVIKWKYFLRYWPFVRGIHRFPLNFSHKGLWRGALLFSLICVWINGSVNSGEASDLRRYHAHCDVTVMVIRNPDA